MGKVTEKKPATSESVQVSIFNQHYSLRSQRGGEHIRQIAQFVDERMRLISSQIATHDLAKIAILAALNIADELQSLKEDFESEVRRRSAQPPEEARPDVPESADAEQGRREGGEPQSWFEAIFNDSDVMLKERNERLSTQVSAKLRSLRQTGSDPLTIESEE